MISRVVPTSLVYAAMIAGCASMGNTLAQDLAWERWEKCKHIEGISLQRIESDGRIWVWYQPDRTGALTQWRECDRRALEEQGRQRVGTSQTPQSVARTEPASAPSPLPLPVWRVGDEWGYRWESPAGAGTFVWVVDRIEALDGGPHYVIRTGTREIFYRVADLAFSRETVDGKIVRETVPSDWRFIAFPLAVGKTWEMKYHERRPQDRQTEDVERACVAEAEETVTVPAGSFATVRIVCKNTRNGAWVLTVWYASQVKHIVREESAVTGGRRVRELLAYRHR